ncbi:hypothetical protein GCM10009681_52700 [Luedemannella helvata]|uniref:Uncharacterized protein n=1 Tax=Luedemannella helvata TaxID=349315 RepID=A0ABP4XED8_9ACTN
MDLRGRPYDDVVAVRRHGGDHRGAILRRHLTNWQCQVSDVAFVTAYQNLIPVLPRPWRR